MLAKDSATGNNEEYLRLLCHAYSSESTNPLSVQNLKDEAVYLYLTNSTLFDSLNFTAARRRLRGLPNQSLSNKRKTIKKTESEIQTTVKDMPYATKATCFAEEDIPKFLETKKVSKTKDCKYIPLRKIFQKIQTLYVAAASSNEKDLNKKLQEKDIYISNLQRFIQATIVLLSRDTDSSRIESQL